LYEQFLGIMMFNSWCYWSWEQHCVYFEFGEHID